MCKRALSLFRFLSAGHFMRVVFIGCATASTLYAKNLLSGDRTLAFVLVNKEANGRLAGAAIYREVPQIRNWLDPGHVLGGYISLLAVDFQF